MQYSTQTIPTDSKVLGFRAAGALHLANGFRGDPAVMTTCPVESDMLNITAADIANRFSRVRKHYNRRGYRCSIHDYTARDPNFVDYHIEVCPR